MKVVLLILKITKSKLLNRIYGIKYRAFLGNN
jgi:hypothetical protein